MKTARLRIPNEEERLLALRVAGVLWLTAAVTSLAGAALLPHVHAKMSVVGALCVAEVAWGGFCVLFPWDRVTALWRHGLAVFHLPTVLSLVFIVAIVWATGGTDSFAAYYLLFVVAYVASFYPPREVAVYICCAIAVAAAPLLYQDDAVADGVYQLIWGATPAYIVLGAVIAVGKSRITRLRDAASTLSLTDHLTGLANRRAFEERVSARLGGGRASDATGLLLVDLDDFKEANTVHGHPGGDLVLRQAAIALRQAAREDDLVARLGGDEFAIVANGADEAGMRALAERVLEAIRRAHERLPEEFDGLAITASVGWARYPQDADTLDELLAAADFCLRGVKASGKNASLTPLDWMPETA
ncbi:MAG: diguanylate cyclase domain-containing protein [Thermoleophilaceae bacterium]